VDAGMDTGKIIAQGTVDVVEDDRAATESSIHKLEHELYTNTLQQLFEN
ncbi:MAG: phosphoribosylglycinamide formyltransferase, partial [Lysinibacillus sp.]